jgi:hypothetical protein
MSKKIRRDAKLKSLPPEQQADVIRIATLHGISQATLDALSAAHGIHVASLNTLSKFWHWWHSPQERVRRELAAAGSVTELLLAKTRSNRPDVSPEALFALGTQMFSEIAIATQDPDTWVKTQGAARDREKVGLKREELELEIKKFQRETCELVLKHAEDQRVKDIAAGAGTNAEKIEQLGQIMFGEDWKS